jgi:hypothetical protein
VRSGGDEGAVTTMADVLRGTVLEGAATTSTTLDEGQLEVVLLWAVASVRQSSMRSSVVRPLGSDTSWIAKDAKKK